MDRGLMGRSCPTWSSRSLLGSDTGPLCDTYPHAISIPLKLTGTFSRERTGRASTLLQQGTTFHLGQEAKEPKASGFKINPDLCRNAPQQVQLHHGSTSESLQLLLHLHSYRMKISADLAPFFMWLVMLVELVFGETGLQLVGCSEVLRMFQ